MRRLLTYLLLFLNSHVSGQKYVTSMQHWSVKEGLSHRQVNSIIQDSRGFVWIATVNGLNRFDGRNFTWYTKELDSLTFNYVSSMTEDASGNFWLVGPREMPDNVAVFHPITRKCTPCNKLKDFPRGIHVNDVRLLPDSSVLFTEFEHEHYFTWHPSRGVKHFVLPQGYFRISYVAEKNAFLVQNSSQEIGLLTMNGVMLKKANAPFVMTSKCFDPTPGEYIKDRQNRHIYFVSPELEVRYFDKELPAENQEFADIVFDVGCDSIKWRQGKLFHPQAGLLRDFVAEGYSDLKSMTRAVMRDNKGRVWIGNDFGVFLLTVNRNKFRPILRESWTRNFNSNSYRAIVVENNMLYACNEFKGSLAINMNTGETRALFPSINGKIGFYALKKISDGTFFGSYENYIYKISNRGKAEVFTFPRPNGCWYIYDWDAQRFLLATGRGLMWLDRTSGTHSAFSGYQKYAELSGAIVLYIAPDNNGQRWICANSGFYALDGAGEITARYSSADTGVRYLPSKEFQHFYQDDAGIYWLATADGLIRWDRQKSKCKLYTRNDGLSNENIHAVYEDKNNNLWLSSDYGLMRLDKTTGSVKIYLTEDGISDNEFNRISHQKDDSGNIYFGSLNGITAFNPKDFVNDTNNQRQRSTLAITLFQQFDGSDNQLKDKTAELLRTNKITITPEDRFFTLDFALLNYSDPTNTTYLWKIDGLDKEWNNQKDKKLELSRLPYGTWTLHIKAQASDGNWGKNELQIQIHVLPPFYLRWWFIAGSIAGFVLVAVVLYRLRTRQLLRDNEKLERTVEMKTADLQVSLAQSKMLMKEIHHRVKNNLQVISSLLQIQANGVDDDRSRSALLEGHNRIMSMAVIHQKLYQKEQINTLELSALGRDLFAQIAGLYPGKNVRLKNNIRETNISIDAAVPLGLILNELMTNSFKYAFGDSQEALMALSLDKMEDKFVMQYSDNGPGLKDGINVDEMQSLGLRLIYGLAGQLQGEVKYEYKEGATFTVYFKLPS